MSRKRSNGEWTDEEWSKWASRTGYFARQRRRMLRHPQPQPPSQNAQNAAPENVQPTEHASNDCPNDCVKRQHSPQSLWLVCMKLVWLSCNMLQHLTSKFWYHSDFHPLEVSWIRLRWCGTAIAADTSIGSAQKLLPLSNPARSLAIYFHILYIMELRVHEEKVILQGAWFSIVFD